MTDVSAAGVPAQPTAPAVPITPVPAAPVIAGSTPSAEGASVVVGTPSEGAAPALEGQAAPAEPAVIAGDVQPPADGVIAGDAPVEEPKPAEAEPPAEPAVEAAPTTPPEPIKYEPWALPEGVSLAEEQTGALNNILGKYNLSQDAGQEIVAYGAGLIKQAQEAMSQAQHDVFAESRAAQRKEFEKQAGNRRETVLADAKAGLALAMPNAKARAALLDVLTATGAGDNTHLIHAFATIGKQSRERSAPGPTLSTPKPSTAPERRYGKGK